MQKAKYSLEKTVVTFITTFLLIQVVHGQIDTPIEEPQAPIGIRIKVAWDNLKTLHKGGGATMYFIDASLILGVAFILERLSRMRRAKILPTTLLKSTLTDLDKQDLEKIKQTCLQKKYYKSTLAKIILYLIESKSQPYLTEAERQTTVNELASRDIDIHRMMCFPLAAIAGLAPLMGLLGTVIGIRESFRTVALAGEMGNPAMLAGGIEKALITTIYGLIVAIACVAFFNIFKFRISLIAIELEEVVSGLLARPELSKKD